MDKQSKSYLRLDPDWEYRKLTLKPRDYKIFQYLDGRFLTMEYLAALLRADGFTVGLEGLQNRLLVLLRTVNTDPENAQTQPYLYRPRFQLNSNFLARKAIFGNRPPAQTALAAKGLAKLYTHPPEREHDLHRFMRSCTEASLELGFRRLAWDWYDFDAFIKYEGCPDATKKLPNPMTFYLPDNRTYTADGVPRVFTKEHFLTWFKEDDRNTEALKSGHTQYISKIHKIDHIIQHELCKEQWGISALTGALHITTTPGRALSMLDLIREHSMYPDRHLVKVAHYFQTEGWEVPPVMYDLVDEPWLSINGPVYLNQ